MNIDRLLGRVCPCDIGAPLFEVGVDIAGEHVAGIGDSHIALGRSDDGCVDEIEAGVRRTLVQDLLQNVSHRTGVAATVQDQLIDAGLNFPQTLEIVITITHGYSPVLSATNGYLSSEAELDRRS